MFKNALLFRLSTEKPLPTAQELQSHLEKHTFVECAATQTVSWGWVPPRPKDGKLLVEEVGGQLLMRLQTQEKKVPSSVLKKELETKLKEIEQATGRKPRGKAKKEIKEELEQTLLPRAFSKTSSTLIWVDPVANLIYVGTGSAKVSDNAVSRLVASTEGGIGVQTLTLMQSVGSVMSSWLQQKEAAGLFDIGRECVLEYTGEMRGAIKYTNHTLEGEDVEQHIREGKVPTQVGLFWNGRISFVLTDTFGIRKIKLIDVDAAEASGASEEAGSSFDADVALFTGQMREMIPELIEVFGGAKAKEQQPA